MAYDILLRRHTNRQYSRGEAVLAEKPVSGFALLAVLSLAFAPRLVRYVENRQIRKASRYDYDRGRPVYQLHKTQQLPAVTMAEMIEGGFGNS